MFILLLIGLSPVPLVAEDTVDLVEVNSLYNWQGRLVLEQVIFYDFVDDIHLVRAWRLLKVPWQYPVWEGGYYTATWVDGEVLRRVKAKHFRRTHLQYDPEMRQRCIFPVNSRPGLRSEP